MPRFEVFHDPKHLSAPLRALVRRASTLWGQIVREQAGETTYRKVEALRRRMALLRDAKPDALRRALSRELARLENDSGESVSSIAHAFAALLEIINACENAYRAQRLRSKTLLDPPPGPGRDILLVLTSHPTEARSVTLLALIRDIQATLGSMLESGPAALDAREALRGHFRVLWRLSLSPSAKPSVKDEAHSLLLQALRPEILAVIGGSSLGSSRLLLRTWVGGDKDGHPGVNATTLRASLQISRKALLEAFREDLETLRSGLVRVEESGRGRWRGHVSRLSSALAGCERALKALQRLQHGDAARMRAFRRAFARLKEAARADGHGTQPPELARLERLLAVFPALVLPLELRESAELLPNGPAIGAMLRSLKQLARGGDVQDYARGLIISQVETLEDLRHGCELVRRVFNGRLALPVVPLFEKASALEASKEILQGYVALPEIREALKHEWRGRLEVMLGYSDSGKEMGVLPSRDLIRRTVHGLESMKRDWEWVFFHGSGGSVARGGGNLEEQTAWWPAEALSRYKVTVQGEMVQRNFAMPEILWSYADTVRRLKPAKRTAAPSRTERQAFEVFLQHISERYRASVSDPDFLSLVKEATAYRYLNALRIGSRPNKRKALEGMDSLRAIPWILAWTQTRLLLPTWWGVGSAWRRATLAERRRLCAHMKNDPLFRAFVKQLGFTLAKIELGVWELYLEHSELAPELKVRFRAEIRRELADTVAAFRGLSGTRNLLWFRPWLGDSIRLRAPLIHPLNLAQIVALKRRNADLLSETVMGVASGMLTTG
jgi:phosphoenolpyruvate carboxylase